jgi:hypothetical protein
VRISRLWWERPAVYLDKADSPGQEDDIQ